MARPRKYTEEQAKRAKKESDAKRHTEKLDRIVIQPYKEEGAKIRAAAAKSPEGSVQGYVLNAVRARIAQEDESAGE